MNQYIITNSATKETKIYTAKFDRYSSNINGEVFLNFKSVTDDGDNIIREYLRISSSKALHLVGNLFPEQEVSFRAQIISDENSPGGFDFANIVFCY